MDRLAWRPAPSVKLGLTEANMRWPDRNTASDGILGDAAHSSRTSDHNPDENGVVHAFDLTHDPAHGVDCGRLSTGIVERRDPRLRYVIFNRRLCRGPWSDGVMAGRAEPWHWEPYTGPNPHDKHMHVSVGYAASAENDLSPWYSGFGSEGGDMELENVTSEGKTDLVEVLDRGFTAGLAIQGTASSNATVQIIVNELKAIHEALDAITVLLTPPPTPEPTT